MADNTFTATEAAKVAASLVAQDAYLCSMVSRNHTDQVLTPGRGGAPVQVKIPATLIARTRDPKDHTNAIEMDSITERTQTVELSPAMDYSAVPLSEWDLNLGIQDFGSQVLAPQCEAVVDQLEHKVASVLQGVEASEIAYDPDNPVACFTDIRKALRDNGVSPSGLHVVVGTGVYADLLDADALQDASQAGDASALRDGQVGRLRGLTIAESNRLEDGEIIAFHRDAVTLVTRAPAVPLGAPYGASTSHSGFSLRYLRDYDAKTAEDRSVVATFSAVAILPTFKIERNYSAKTAQVVEVPNGGVIRVVASA